MKKRTIFIILLLFAGLVISAAFYLGKNSASIQGQAVLDNPKGLNEITLSELATHSFETDCWIAYKSEVFDLTDWLQKHPGGVDAILPTCGTKEKFEEFFTKQHGTSKVQFLVKVGQLMGMLKYEGQLTQ